MTARNERLTINGRTYRWMDKPLVVVCVNGCEPDYITQAIQAGGFFLSRYWLMIASRFSGA